MYVLKLLKKDDIQFLKTILDFNAMRKYIHQEVRSKE
jgi:hypothetical protein